MMYMAVMQTRQKTIIFVNPYSESHVLSIIDV